MRVVAWNCHGGFHRKAVHLSEEAFDLAVVSEVDRRSLEGSEGSHLWTGRPGKKGLALIGAAGWELESLYDHPVRHVLACRASRVDISLILVGVWTLPVGNSYVTPIASALDVLAPMVAGDAIIAGDFNANLSLDRNRAEPRLFRPVLDRLAGLGFASVWHERSGERHGEEATPTFFLTFNPNRPMHLDYVFASAALRARLASVRIGSPADWLEGRRSDHLPVIADFSD